MNRIFLIAALAALALAVPALGAGSSRPTLTLTNGKVHGSHFHTREVVRVTIGAPIAKRLTVRASKLGAFTLTKVPNMDPCSDSVVIVAVGATGDTARMKLMPRMCPPAERAP